jgi:predicted acylesterase/phospholipase RssA
MRITTQEIIQQLDHINISPLIQEKFHEFANRPNQKLVLSLGGGGAKGMVGNIALIYLLEKLDLMADFSEVWGVSAGAVVGATYCAGLSPEDIIDLMASLRIKDFVDLSLKSIFDAEPGFIRTDKIHSFFVKKLPRQTFEECRKPLFILATRYTSTSEQIVKFQHGPLADAVTASLSIPDIFEAYTKDGQKFVDGGLLENTPCISIAHQHVEQNDPRKLTIISTCFGEDHFAPEGKSFTGKLSNILGVYRYRLQLEQLERTRMFPNTTALMLDLDIPISKVDFGKMGPVISPTYVQLLDKLSYIVDTNNWNITY